VANLASNLFGISVQNAKDHERESRLDNAFILSTSSSLRIFSIICYHIFGSYHGQNRDLAKPLLSDTTTTSSNLGDDKARECATKVGENADINLSSLGGCRRLQSSNTSCAVVHVRRAILCASSRPMKIAGALSGRMINPFRGLASFCPSLSSILYPS